MKHPILMVPIAGSNSATSSCQALHASCRLNLILAISGAISAFDIPYIMTDGSNGSMTFVIQTVHLAFKYGKLGLASAMAVVLLLIVILVTLVQRVTMKGEE